MTDKEIIRFNVLTADLKYIFSTLKPAIPKVDSNPVHQYIKFQGKDNLLSAYAMDGYRIHSVSVDIDTFLGDEKTFSFLLKPFAIPKTDTDFIPCELYDKEIKFNFGEQKIICKLGTGEIIDVKEFIPTKPITYRVGFNPKYLAEAAKSLKNNGRNSIVIEFRKPLDPVMIYNSKDKSDFRMVLPVRLREENNDD